jgi:Peroxidase
MQHRTVSFLLFAVAPLLLRRGVFGQQVRADRECYSFGEGFQVTYSGADAVDDWIAIVPVASLDRITDNNNNLLLVQDDDVIDWAWKCGDTPCPQTSGSVLLPNTVPPGEYVAVLARSTDQEPYPVFATSPTLMVADDCSTGVGPDAAPVATPTPRVRPAEVPVPVPPPPPPSSNGNAEAAQALANARSMIASMIASDADLAPKFLRLVFHDCIGGCDGCVDLTNPENFGLEKPIDALERVFEQHGGAVSRADLWALSATVAVDVVQSSRDAIDFPFGFWGREDCTLRSTCAGAGGRSVPCTPKFGPHHEHPSIHLNTADLYHFFASEFGLSAREAVVAMAGGHTIGSLSIAVRPCDYE